MLYQLNLFIFISAVGKVILDELILDELKDPSVGYFVQVRISQVKSPGTFVVLKLFIRMTLTI